jgi:tRNA dimethylallyltransferase
MPAKTLVVIEGPTGSGKTDLSVAVAQHFGASIISADSRQLFMGMPIGTAQPSAEQLAAVKHYFIGCYDVAEPYTSGRYEREAMELLGKLFADDDVAVMVGGSGLYIDAVCNGVDSLPQADEELRGALMRRLETDGLETLTEQLRRLDPEYYEKVDRSNYKRVVRALEVCLHTGKTYTELRTGRKKERPFRTLKIGALLPREELYERINRRVDKMMAAGLEDEARRFYPFRDLNALQTVGYREMFDYFDGKITRDEAIELIKRNSRRYAKRQMTWFGRDEEIRWFAPTDTDGVISYIESEQYNK